MFREAGVVHHVPMRSRFDARRLGFLAVAVIYLVTGWKRDGPVLPIASVIVAGVLILVLMAIQRRRDSRSSK